jgi:hypothetical protein
MKQNKRSMLAALVIFLLLFAEGNIHAQTSFLPARAGESGYKPEAVRFENFSAPKPVAGEDLVATAGSDNGTGFSSAKSLRKKSAKGNPLEFFFGKKTSGEAKDYGEGRSAVIKSAMLPGWGLYTTVGNKYGFINTPVVGGSIILGFVNIGKARKSYKTYYAARTQDEMEKNFEKIKAYQKDARSWFFIAGAVYAWQLFRTYTCGKFNERYKKRAEHWSKNLAVGVVPNLYDAKNPVSVCANVKF